MTSDTPHEGEHRDPMDGAAAIVPVTGEMMDHAAHEAAALADGVAHHAVEPETAVLAESAEGVGDVARDTAGAAGALSTELSDAAVREAGVASSEALRATERTAEAARESTAAAADALAQYNAKLLEVMRTNISAASRHVAALVQVKSVPEAMSLNAEHLRQQFEAMTAQSRELALLAQRVAFDAMRPFKRSVDG